MSKFIKTPKMKDVYDMKAKIFVFANCPNYYIIINLLFLITFWFKVGYASKRPS